MGIELGHCIAYIQRLQTKREEEEETMEGSLKLTCILGLLVAFAIAGLDTVGATGECGQGTSPDKEAYKLVPCADAAKDQNMAVPQKCCAQVSELINLNPRCLCAVMLSKTAKESGINLQIAITIPKRCNIMNRPAGKKCGDYTVP